MSITSKNNTARPIAVSVSVELKKVNRFACDKTVGEEQWLTPKKITDALGPFDVDPCSPIKRPWATAAVHWTKKTDGFNRKWSPEKFFYVNPPYGSECPKWLEKAANQGNCLALIFARTDTSMFHNAVFNHDNASAVFFFKGRLKFCTVDGKASGSAGAPSAIIAYGELGKERLIKAVAEKKLNGRIFLLNDGQTSVYRLGIAGEEVVKTLKAA
jgi:hypothetical protein